MNHSSQLIFDTQINIRKMDTKHEFKGNGDNKNLAIQNFAVKFI